MWHLKQVGLKVTQCSFKTFPWYILVRHSCLGTMSSSQDVVVVVVLDPPSVTYGVPTRWPSVRYESEKRGNKNTTVVSGAECRSRSFAKDELGRSKKAG